MAPGLGSHLPQRVVGVGLRRQRHAGATGGLRALRRAQVAHDGAGLQAGQRAGQAHGLAGQQAAHHLAAGVVGRGHVGVELELDDLAAGAVLVGRHLARHLGQDVGPGELQRQRQRRRAVGVQARLGFGLGLDVAQGADVDGAPAVDLGRLGHRGGAAQVGIGHGQRAGEARGLLARHAALLLALGLGGHLGVGRGVRGDVDHRPARDPGAVLDVDAGAGLGLRIAHAEQAALGLAAGVGAGRGVDADGQVGDQLRAFLHRELGLGRLDQHLDGQAQQVLHLADKRVEDELALQLGQTQL